jgi:hypothetical protein
MGGFETRPCGVCSPAIPPCAIVSYVSRQPDPIRAIWNRVRSLSSKVEEEIYDFAEEEAERDQEPRGRNTLIALIHAFMTMWKAGQATAAERRLGLLAFAGVLWLVIGDRGFGYKRTWLRIPAVAFAAIWFVPGFIAAAWTLCFNTGLENARRVRLWPLFFVWVLSGLIGFRGVFQDFARKRLRSVRGRGAAQGGDPHPSRETDSS